MALDNHILYYKPTCPYCQKVLSFMASAEIECGMRDTSDPDAAAELVSIGGKKQVPCLVIGGKALYESDDIIVYLRQHATA